MQRKSKLNRATSFIFHSVNRKKMFTIVCMMEIGTKGKASPGDAQQNGNKNSSSV
jgi:hypothetical protein